MTRNRTLTLEEAKAVLDKLAELRSEVSEVLEEPARRLQELVDGARNAQRAIEEALAPLREASRDENWARKFVVDTARRTLSEVGPDSKIGGGVRDCLSDLPNLFARFDALEMAPATRDAANEILEEIIANVHSVGLASNDPNDFDLAAWRRKDFKEKQAAALRKTKAAKFAPREAEELDALRVALNGKIPVDTLMNAERIASGVKEILGRPLALSRIRRLLNRLARKER